MTDAPRNDPTLTVVATPIGNLGDLTPRAAEALAVADVIACEDTRRTAKLFAAIDARTERAPMVVVNEHTEFAEAPKLVGRMLAGERVVLVSDAGTPVVSDPGGLVIRQAIDAGIAVDVLPGASAATTALVASGLDASRFTFEGFLPRKGQERHSRLAAVGDSDCTTVIYESPGRVHATLLALGEVCGADRQVVLCRELTKLHQEVMRGTVSEVAELVGSTPLRGEIVLVVDARPAPTAASDRELYDATVSEMAAGMSRRDAAAVVSERHGVSRRRVYELSLGEGPPPEV